MSEPDARHLHLGRRLRAIRDELGVSAEEMARRMQMSTSTVWTLETGRRSPRMSTLLAYGDALGVSVEITVKEPG